MNGEHKPAFVLWHNTYSICSIMVRYTIKLRGTPRSPASEMTFEEREVDIFHDEQLEESFFCEVNPKGQVSEGPIPQHPALALRGVKFTSHSILLLMFYYVSRYRR
jgi:hypothetical protein